jgi:hypothetical protein
MEVWKTIEGFENYEISNLGRLKGLEITTKFGCTFKKYPERICNYWSDKKGYKYYTFVINGKNRHKLIHRLVAKAFILNTDNKPQINHINGIKSDNRVENLEWCTAKENLLHARETGLNNISGVNHYRSKLTIEDVILIRNSNETQRFLSEKYNICQGSISDIKLFKTYKNVRTTDTI